MFTALWIVFYLDKLFLVEFSVAADAFEQPLPTTHQSRLGAKLCNVISVNSMHGFDSQWWMAECFLHIRWNLKFRDPECQNTRLCCHTSSTKCTVFNDHSLIESKFGEQKWKLDDKTVYLVAVLELSVISHALPQHTQFS